LAFSLARPELNSPLPFGPSTGTSIATGAVQASSLRGRPRSPIAWSMSVVSRAASFPLPTLPLTSIDSTDAGGAHCGSASLAWLRQKRARNRQLPSEAPSASQTSPSRQVTPLKRLAPSGNPTPSVRNCTRQSRLLLLPPSTVTAWAAAATRTKPTTGSDARKANRMGESLARFVPAWVDAEPPESARRKSWRCEDPAGEIPRRGIRAVAGQPPCRLHGPGPPWHARCIARGGPDRWE
jgi:hypothetical protein